MFADACGKMTKCTRPVIVSTLAVDGTVNSTIGSFVVINNSGWAITAAHMVSSFRQHRIDSEEIDKVDKHNKNNPGDKKKYNPKWLKAQSFWWSWDDVVLEAMHVFTDIDLALIKLANFKPGMVSEYPTFKDPNKIRIGMSVCRIGFPFVKAVTTYVPDTKSFMINRGVLPVAYFPNDGIFTRTLKGERNHSGGYDRLYIETSSPGLKGQSGGPIFDKVGNIMGIQTTTAHMDLGFETQLSIEGERVGKQYLNAGIGTHVSTIMNLLNKYNIKYKSEADDDGYRIIN